MYAKRFSVSNALNMFYFELHLGLYDGTYQGSDTFLPTTFVLLQD
jgi:hypothetical protein